MGWGRQTDRFRHRRGSQGAKRQVELRRPQKIHGVSAAVSLEGGAPCSALPVDQSAGLGPAMLWTIPRSTWRHTRPGAA